MWAVALGVIAVVLIVGFVAVGAHDSAAKASAAASASTASRSVFLQQWHDQFPNVPAADDAGAVLLGRGVCDAYRAGTSFTGEVSYLMAKGYPSGSAGALIGMSTASFCPEYNNRH